MQKKMPEKHHKYKFTVIMPIYNAKAYLQDAIDSVIDQSIGFSDCVQLILVDNASTDSSGSICQHYVERYPDNVRLIRLEENVGPSGARNAGIPFIEGKYTNFFDSDDIWPKDAFSKVWRFFESNYDKTDVVACRMEYFEGKTGYYDVLDDKFQKGDRISDLTVNPLDTQLHVTSSFIKSSAINNLRFDTTMYHLEDSKFLNNIILEKLTIGLLSTVVYQYRRHIDGSSLLQQIRKENKYYYTHTLEHYLVYFVNKSREKYQCVIPYVQGLIAYTLGFRIKEKKDMSILSDEEYNEYCEMIRSLLELVDDRIILDIGTMNQTRKLFALSMKHSDFYDNLVLDDANDLYYGDNCIFSFSKQNIVNIKIMELVENEIVMYGTAYIPLHDEDYRVYFIDDKGMEYDVSYDQHDVVAEALGKEIYINRGFSVHVPADSNKTVTAMVDYCNRRIPLRMWFGVWGLLNNKIDNSYYYKNGIMLKNKKAHFSVSHVNGCFRQEFRLLLELFRKRRYKPICFRILSHIVRKYYRFRGKKVWLFADRFQSADDNGEFMYKYVQKRNDRRIKAYYVIKENSRDYSRLKREGKVLAFDSFKYSLIYSASDAVFSSVNRLMQTKYDVYMKDHEPFRVFLQHGLVEKDISSSWNRLRCNDRIFISSNRKEYDFFLHYNYGFSEREVKLTGMPRDDAIINYKEQPYNEKIICFAPTWRKQLTIGFDPVTHKQMYNPDFVKSEFYSFYNRLINDERVLKKMKENGYRGVLQLHPYFHQQAVDFKENDIISVKTDKERFVDEYRDVKMVITDYSSIAFEYAFIGRSVVYCQFDKDVFYGQHSYDEGYFDYENEGFGPVCYTYKDAVNHIVDAIDHDCIVDDQFSKRMNAFFEYSDGKNCERIYNEVIAL